MDKTVVLFGILKAMRPLSDGGDSITIHSQIENTHENYAVLRGFHNKFIKVLVAYADDDKDKFTEEEVNLIKSVGTIRNDSKMSPSEVLRNKLFALYKESRSDLVCSFEVFYMNRMDDIIKMITTRVNTYREKNMSMIDSGINNEPTHDAEQIENDVTDFNDIPNHITFEEKNIDDEIDLDIDVVEIDVDVDLILNADPVIDFLNDPDFIHDKQFLAAEKCFFDLNEMSISAPYSLSDRSGSSARLKRMISLGFNIQYRMTD